MVKSKKRILSIFILGLLIEIIILQAGFFESIKADPDAVIQNLNNPPTKPTVTYDSSNYVIRISSYDSDQDKIRYAVSWNWEEDHGIDMWTDYHNSGESVVLSCSGKSGQAGVLAEDEHGLRSSWVSVTSKSSTYNFSFFERFIQCFPFLNKILNQIISIN